MRFSILYGSYLIADSIKELNSVQTMGVTLVCIGMLYFDFIEWLKNFK